MICLVKLSPMIQPPLPKVASQMTTPLAIEPFGRRPLANDIGGLLAPIQDGLGQVEAKMKTVDASIFAPLANAFLELIGSGGKRLRPALALLTASSSGRLFGDIPAEQVVALAAAVEMLHTSTLVHDDVIDGALLRRGAPTLNAVWNGGATVLAGNYMFGTAARFAAETGRPRVIRLFADTLRVIVDGELRQLAARHDYHQEKESYAQRIYAKTASLFCAATEGAAILMGLGEASIAQFRTFGYHFGMAFQIVDDILDFTGDETTLGKPAGSDLRQGTLTLPFFYYLQQHPQPEAVVRRLENAQIRLEEGEEGAWREAVTQTVSEVRNSPAIAAAQQEARQLLARARANLTSLPDTVYKESLLGLCDFVVQRSF
jgi:geranylgeranyl pyrophosphate synthase